MITTDGFRWSFSKLTCYEQCPLGFKLRYLDDVPQEDNAFAEFGSFCHMLLENWARGDLMSFELADTYTRLYDDAVIHHFPPFPPGMGQRYYDAGLAYFTNFDGFGDQYKVLAVEDRFQINIHGFPFTGVSDLVLEDRRNGDLLVVDHKSKSAKVMHKQLETYTRQLYIYAAAVRERFGKYPALLWFNLFRDWKMLEEPFDLGKLHETLDWVHDTISVIRHDECWEPRPSDYYCRFICSTFAHCPLMR